MNLSIQKKTVRTSEKIVRFLLESIIIWMIALGGVWYAASLFLTDYSVGQIAIGAGIAAFLLTLLQEQKHGYILEALLFGGMTILVVLFRDSLLNGLIVAWNQLADLMGSHTSVFFSGYQELASDRSMLDQNLLLLLMGFLAASVIFASYHLRLRGILLITAALLPALKIWIGKDCSQLPLLLYIAGILIVELILYDLKKYEPEHGTWLAGYGILCILIISFASYYFWNLILPQKKYTVPAEITAIQKMSEEQIEKIRYKSGEINSLPKGKLEKAGAWKTSDDTALEVTMEDPQSIYLRGFTGSVYGKDGWEHLPYSDCYENKDLFYWLHESGFYADLQLAGTRKLVSDKTLSSSEGKVEVHNLGADSEYLYTPYEMIRRPEKWQNQYGSADETLRSNGIFGTRDYEFISSDNLVKNATQIASLGYSAIRKKENESWESAESYYNTFVYRYDTFLSPQQKALFRKELGEAGADRDSAPHSDYAAVIRKLRSYLEKNITYDTETDLVPEGEDFVSYFLLTEKKGHSVHYATAAALMFRYYGIPARYVEGYLITPEDVKSDSNIITIPGKNGHAWTEIYLDGTGWVPVEMTPEYYGIMEEPDWSIGLEASGNPKNDPETLPEQLPPEEASSLQQVLRIVLFQIGRVILWMFLLFDLFCLVFFLWSIVARILANKKRKKRFAGSDCRNAIAGIAGYSRILAVRQGSPLPDALQKEYEEICRLGEKAVFSNHAMTEEERQQVQEGKSHLLRQLKKTNGWYDKWVMKYIERLY